MDKSQIIAIIKMGRPFVLIAGIIAYFMGLCMAYYYGDTLDISGAIVGLTILISATMMAHYANEYADVDTDTITQRTWYSGGSGVLPSGIIPIKWALWCALILAILTISLTIFYFAFGLLSIQGLIIVAIGLIGGWFYSMPPLKLERTIWGELDNAFLGGFLMPLIAFVPQLGYFDFLQFANLFPIFLAVLINLLGVHWIDRKADENVGKRTLVVELGNNTKNFQAVLIILLYLSTIFLIGFMPLIAILGILLTFPLALWCFKNFENKPMGGSYLMTLIMILAGIGFLIAA